MFVKVIFANASIKERENFLYSGKFVRQNEYYDGESLSECVVQLDSLNELWDLQEMFEPYIKIGRDGNGIEYIKI